MQTDLNRRDFLRNTAAGAAVGAQLASLASPAQARADKANDRLRIGFMGATSCWRSGDSPRSPFLRWP